jgi:hypothetical protein
MVSYCDAGALIVPNMVAGLASERMVVAQLAV